jgi:DNA primase
MKESPSPWIDAAEIKRKVSIERVLTHYGLLSRLERKGETLRGISPFRSETEASFFVHVDGKWNDLGGRPVIEDKEVPGNIIGLVMALEKCSFRKALLKLNELAAQPASPQTSPPATESKLPRPAEPALANVVNETRERAAEATSEKGTVNESFGRALTGLKYDVPFLADRGLTPEKAKSWGVGYCSRGLMKGRVIVPIRNRRSEIVAYVGRSLKESLELFGLERLASDLETQKLVAERGIVVVEGCFDAIALVEHGFKNVVATLGADVSIEQIALLLDPELNPSKRITAFFNNNESGKQGRKKLFAQSIFRGFVRLVDFDRVETEGRTDPEQFTKEELLALLIP